LSLLICFVALFLMDLAQPALLYIVPGTLIPAAVVAFARGEMVDFWNGEKDELENPISGRRAVAADDGEEIQQRSATNDNQQEVRGNKHFLQRTRDPQGMAFAKRRLILPLPYKRKSKSRREVCVEIV